MVRTVIRWEIAYGQAKDAIAGLGASNAVCRRHGWVE
jgi:hypothetical protein